jgi:uncharacterized protein (DUF433 family)
MMPLPETVNLPLKMDPQGVIRVSGTRVTLDTLIGFYQQGQTPEELHEGFPTIPLADIYAVIAYYLAHQAEMDHYLKRQAEQAERIRQEWETRNPPPTKADLLARMKQRGE